MVGMLLYIVIVGMILRVAYGLRRPHFWVYAGLMVLIGLPLVLLMMWVGSVVR